MREKDFSKTVRLFRISENGMMPLTGKDIPRLEYIANDSNSFIRVLDFSNVEHSMRFNPIQRRYLPRLQDCQAMADVIMRNGFSFDNYENFRQCFWISSASNFLAALLYFFTRYEEKDQNGKIVSYSDMPHILAFLNHDYSEIFEILKTNQEICPLLTPFITAYNNKAMEQLEGMLGTLRVRITQLATRESFWILHRNGDDFHLDGRSQTNYVAIVTEKRYDFISRILTSLIIRTDVPDDIELDNNNPAVRRILDFQCYRFDSKEAREDILWQNYQSVLQDIDTMIQNFKKISDL